MVKHFNIPIFVPHAGCPHDCVFCNQKKITGLNLPLTLTAIDCLIQDHLESIGAYTNEKHVEIAFFGGSFTGIPLAMQEGYLSLANRYKQAGLIDGIRLSTRPDYINEEILDHLKHYGVTTIELGVQSLDDVVLKNSHRGHKAEIIMQVSEMIRKNGFQLGLQMMIGLPGDSLEISKKSARQMIRCMPDFVRIYPTLVIKETKLEEMYNRGLYNPLSLEEAVIWTSEIFSIFRSNDIDVIRIGLQASEEFEMKSYVAGPYHPSFRQLVEGYLFKIKLQEVLIAYEKIESLTYYVSSASLSSLVGQKRENLRALEAKYNINKIRVFSKEMAKNYFECHLTCGDQKVIIEATI